MELPFGSVEKLGLFCGEVISFTEKAKTDGRDGAFVLDY